MVADRALALEVHRDAAFCSRLTSDGGVKISPESLRHLDWDILRLARVAAVLEREDPAFDERSLVVRERVVSNRHGLPLDRGVAAQLGEEVRARWLTRHDQRGARTR
ncbi:MAG: hypothetical protein H6713_42280 [Myxococcales bacterium]|nr:hypothetical protein [Myxococcales bacterium]